MDKDEPSALLALVAIGLNDSALHWNTDNSVFDKTYKKVSRSTFTYRTISCQPLQEDGMTYVLYLNTWHEGAVETMSKFDLIGDCYMSFKASDVGYDVMDECTIECAHISNIERWTSIETLKASTFTM